MKLHSTFLLLLFSLSTFSQGLKIQGNDYVIDERTGYSVFDKQQPTFTNIVNLSFEIAPQDFSGAYARGYVLRIKNKEQSTTYNILYNGQGGSAIFSFNHEGRDVLITAELDKEVLYAQQWISFHISFDLVHDSLMLQIHDKKYYAIGLSLQPKWKPCIHFGRSEHVIDIPTFALRDLKIDDGEKMYHFPLNESEGEAVHDIRKRVIGHVTNPKWLINDAYYWNFRASFHSTSVAGSIFNPESQEIYYVNKDFIVIYNVRTGETTTKEYTNQCPMVPQLGTTFIDYQEKRLYVYDVSQLRLGGVTIAYLDLENYAWTAVSSAVLPTQLHHHCSFLDETNRRYILFGGFGNTFYNKEFYSYRIDSNKWDTLFFGGDEITPRYFSSMGYEKESNVLYLFGGMGNASGHQEVGRMYYYDLYKIDLNNDSITKLWEIAWDKENMVPVRGLLLENDSTFYTLCYPEHFSNSLLRLYRFSLKDGSYEILGDSIPIVSEKITTHANLYYNKNMNNLYAIVQEFEHDDIASTASVYSLLFPPVTSKELMIYTASNREWWMRLMAVVVICTALLMVGAYMWKEKKKKKVSAPISKSKDIITTFHSPVPQQESRPNSICLFGEFSMTDRHNREINYMLSTKLKQAFFLILGCSLDNGITSQEFGELLWPDKSEDKVKNSRGVTLNNLRKILNELDGIKLVYEKGYFKILLSEECYCDYMRCMEIASGNEIELHMDELMAIVLRGKFLKSTDSSLLDSFKNAIESRVEQVLGLLMEKMFLSGNYVVVTQLCEGIFNIDPLSEETIYYLINALMKLKADDEAKLRYLQFTMEYKKTMGVEYSKSFSKLWKE